MNFVELLLSGNSPYFELIEYLKRSELPLYIFGAGSYAELYCEQLQSEGLAVSGVCVDKQYWSEGQSCFGNTVQTFDEVAATVAKCDMLLAISPGNVKDGLVTPAQTAVVRIKAQIEQSGYNYFPPDSVVIFDLFGPKTDFDFICKQRVFFEQSFSLFEDELSKKVFLNILRYKITKDYRYLHGIVTKGEYVEQGVISFQNEETLVDAGAYDGDTIEALAFHIAQLGGSISKIYAIEPDAKNYQKLTRFVERNTFPFVIECIRKGLSNTHSYVSFSDQNNMKSAIVEGDTGMRSSDSQVLVEIDKLDSILHDQKGVSFIKMDIEGVELKALEGAKNTICKNRPKLAICVYHKREDLYSIPLYLKSLVPEYKFYLRNYHYMGVGTVLYAVFPH